MDEKDDYPEVPQLKRRRTGIPDALRYKASIILDRITDEAFIQACISAFEITPKLLLKHLIFCGSLPANFDFTLEHIYTTTDDQSLFLDYLKSLQ